MSLLATIRKDQLQARKDRDTIKASVLTTLIGEASMIGKNDGNRETTDEEVVRVIKKFINGIDISLQATYDTQYGLQLQKEKDLLSVYLPTQMTREMIEDVVSEYIEQLGVTNMKGMGAIMGKLKQNYDGQYDGSVASAIVRQLLQ